MSAGAPYRESDVVDCVERACPACGARVFYAVSDTSATCDACNMHFAIIVQGFREQSRKREPLHRREDPTGPFLPADEPDVDDLATAEHRRLANVVGLAALAACVVTFALGGVVMGAATVLCAAGVIAATNRPRPELKGVDET